MKIVFLTTQSPHGSTVIGRVIPIAERLAKQHKVSIFGHQGALEAIPSGVHWTVIGKDPFERTEHGKRRIGGIHLIARMKLNALKTVFALAKTKPEIAVIVKPLPQNVLAAWMYHIINSKTKFILDVDDFELTANHLTSIWQRAAIHWSERSGAKLAKTIIAATPFLQDHFTQLTNGNKTICLVPTGIQESLGEHVQKNRVTRQGVSHAPEPRHRRVGESAAAGPNTNPMRAKGPSTLLYIGSISISSGHRVDLLPDILEQVRQVEPDTKLLIAGSGDDITKLKQQFVDKHLTDAVEWAGRFSQSDISNLLAKTTIIIDPIDGSIVSRAKSSFRTALAGLTGTPIVTSNIGIRPALIPASLHEKCFAQPNDPQDYVAKTIALIQTPLTPTEQKSMQSHAREYTWDTLAPRYDHLISR